MSERSNPICCTECDALVTKRIPQIQTIHRESNVGKVVEQAIKDNANLLKEQKENRLKESR